MSDSLVVDLQSERSKRLHDAHEKRLKQVQNAFAQALPLPNSKKKSSKSKNKGKKK